MIFCPACGGDVYLLGELGSLRWFRCRACGLDSQKTYRRRKRAARKPKTQENDHE